MTEGGSPDAPAEVLARWSIKRLVRSEARCAAVDELALQSLGDRDGVLEAVFEAEAQQRVRSHVAGAARRIWRLERRRPISVPLAIISCLVRQLCRQLDGHPRPV